MRIPLRWTYLITSCIVLEILSKREGGTTPLMEYTKYPCVILLVVLEILSKSKRAGFNGLLQRVAVDRFRKSRYNSGVRWAR